MADNEVTPIRRAQTIAVAVAGAVAVICFVLSLVTSADAATVLRTTAGIAAGCCALIGVSFAIVGRPG